MFLGPRQQRVLERVDPRHRLVEAVADEHLEVGRDLVVARPGGVQLARRRPDQFAEPLFDVHMDVFEARILDQPAGGILFANPVQPRADRCRILGRDDALGAEHRGMRL